MADYTWKQWEAEQNDANLLHASDCERWQAGIELAGGSWDGEWTDLDTSGKGLITIDQFNALESQIQSKVSSYTPKGYDPDSTVQIVPGPDGWNKVEDGILKAVCEPDGINRNYLINSTGDFGTGGWSATMTVVDGYSGHKAFRTGRDAVGSSRLLVSQTLTGLNGKTLKAGDKLSIGLWYYADSSFDWQDSYYFQYFLREFTEDSSSTSDINLGSFYPARGTVELDTWVRLEATVELPYNLVSQQLRFYIAINGTGYVNTSLAKVEIGDEVTEWRPAPEDYGYPENTTLKATQQSVEDSDEVAAPAPEAEEIE